MGSEEVSALANAIAAHTANFLAMTGVALAQRGLFAARVGTGVATAGGQVAGRGRQHRESNTTSSRKPVIGPKGRSRTSQPAPRLRWLGPTHQCCPHPVSPQKATYLPVSGWPRCLNSYNSTDHRTYGLTSVIISAASRLAVFPWS